MGILNYTLRSASKINSQKPVAIKRHLLTAIDCVSDFVFAHKCWMMLRLDASISIKKGWLIMGLLECFGALLLKASFRHKRFSKQCLDIFYLKS